MAQHVPTRLLKPKRFRVIEHGINYAFARSCGLMQTSMQYRLVDEQEGNHVYHVQRKIPRGFVYNSEVGNFEVHYNPVSRKIVEIYLVA